MKKVDGWKKSPIKIMPTTETIYNCLEKSFWTKRKCLHCQKFFTASDYLNQNYQLTFLKVLKAQENHLEVVVQLQHKQCFFTNSLNYQSQIVYAEKK